MTVRKRWEIERNRNRFSPNYLEHEDWKLGDYGAHFGFYNYQGGGK